MQEDFCFCSSKCGADLCSLSMTTYWMRGTWKRAPSETLKSRFQKVKFYNKKVDVISLRCTPSNRFPTSQSYAQRHTHTRIPLSLYEKGKRTWKPTMGSVSELSSGFFGRNVRLYMLAGLIIYGVVHFRSDHLQQCVIQIKQWKARWSHRRTLHKAAVPCWFQETIPQDSLPHWRMNLPLSTLPNHLYR